MRVGFVQLWKRIERGIRSYNERRAEAFRPQSRKAPHKTPPPASKALEPDSGPQETPLSLRVAAEDPLSKRLAVTPERPTTIDDVNKAIVDREKESTTLS